MPVPSLLSNVLSRLLQEWNILNQKQSTEALHSKMQIMEDVRILYDEAAALLHEEQNMYDFCCQTYETIMKLDPMEANLHFSTHLKPNYEPA